MMEAFDRLTGEVISEGYSSPLKRMCLNCEFCTVDSERGYVCTNEKVNEAGKKKALESLNLPDGFEIQNIDLKPMLLKNPTKKCGNYTVNLPVVQEELNKIFM